ncbi:MAG TPA: NAD(P)-dependent oxidoreductase [Opitutaceae bacterium]|jgi:3-hydroxyisobutyrate dehydrogenase|nr:NAD(P)-dependent oxidoreductase [Opitutaceae bacterium]
MMPAAPAPSLHIAFVGTGVMGASMAGHLLAAGHRLHVHNRTAARAQGLIAAGARWHESPGAAAAEAEVVITMVGFPADVEQIHFGAGGILERVKPGTLLIDMTTSSPVLARRIAEAAARKGCGGLDAPVSGGDVGAREARLVIMAGGAAADFERAKPLFERMGKNIALLGPAGSGQSCKMANQIAVAVGMVAWVEALAYARKAGLDPAQVHASISGGAAGSWAMTHLAPRALAGNFAPGFYVKHLLKDLKIALDSAREIGADLPGLALAQRVYEEVSAMGWQESGTQVLYRRYTES